MPRLRSLDVSAPGARFDIDPKGVEAFLSSLPPSLEELDLRGWGVVLELQQPAVAGAAEERLPRDTPEAVASSEAILRARLRARAAVICTNIRVYVGLLPLLAARAPGLRRLMWVRLLIGPGIWPRMLLGGSDATAAMLTFMRMGLGGMPRLTSVELVDANDDLRVTALAATLGAVRCLSLAGGPHFTDSGCAALGRMASLRVLTLDLCDRGEATSAGVAGLIRQAGTFMRALRFRSVAWGGDAEAMEAVHAALRRATTLTAVELIGCDGAAIARLVRRHGAAGLVPGVSTAEFDAAWAAAVEAASVQ